MIRTSLRAAVAAATLSTFILPALAHDSHSHTAHADTHAIVHVGNLEISGAFTRATLPGQPVGGGYLTITNSGDSDDILIGGSASFAGEVQVHEMAVVNDVMNMRHLADGLAVPAGETVSLRPGGAHLMFMQLNGPLIDGETVTVTLEFQEAGTVEVGFDVVAPGTSGSQDHSGHEMPGHADCEHGSHDLAH